MDIERGVVDRLERLGLRCQGTSELQLRDVRSIIRLVDALDWPYLERYAALLGIRDRLEAVRGG